MIGSLYTQSEYSMLKNLIPLETLVIETKNRGYQFLALSDNNLHGMIRFFELCKREKLKPILGLSITVSNNLEEVEFLIYAKDFVGYQNLLNIYYLKEHEKHITENDIKQYSKGIIGVSSGSSLYEKLIISERFDELKHTIENHKNIFENFYIGLSLDTFDLEFLVAPKLFSTANELNIKVLPIHRVSYLNKNDRTTYEALIKIEDSKNKLDDSADYSLFNIKELETLFNEYPITFMNLNEFLNKINYTFEKPAFALPNFPTKNDVSAKLYLEALSKAGLKKRIEQNNIQDEKKYQERLIHELNIIDKLGYNDYFLIVYDVIRYAKTNNILVGPGRGSAAGSLVSYCLGITNVDPIAYDLIFERFLNPERKNPPDIDMDFPDDKRDLVIEYVKEKYGTNHIASIATFGTFQLKSSIRDISKVYGLDVKETNSIIEKIINNEKIDNPKTINLIEIAKKIEGLPRHTGTHPAGIILSNLNLKETLPLQTGAYSFDQIAFDAATIDDLKLLKIDFLGLRNLSVIKQILEELELKNIDIKLDKINLEDNKTYDLLSQADTDGVFQLESAGIRNVLRKLKPQTFEDIVAVLALFRPGPMNHIDTYIERKNGKPFDYIDQSLEPILKSTYGIIVYQEQIMRIASDFAGYSLAEADLLRRGVSKKDHEILENERKKFIDYSIKNGKKIDIANEIYNYIVAFADYGFNRSHSVAYALIAYQMAYLKANHYLVFMTSLLNSISGDERLTEKYLSDLKNRGYRIFSPSVNKSGLQYRSNQDAILLPLHNVKSIGKQTAQNIILEREKGLFKDYTDLKIRLKSIINERQLHYLIYAGALDEFKVNKQTLIENSSFDTLIYEQYMERVELKVYEDYQIQDLIKFEKEALGYNIKYQLSQLIGKQETKLEDFNNKSKIEIKVLIKSSKVIETKQKRKMAFWIVDDGLTELEVTVFSNDFEKYLSLGEPNFVKVSIEKNNYNHRVTYIVSNIQKT